MKGWHYESYRHALAAKGVCTARIKRAMKHPDVLGAGAAKRKGLSPSEKIEVVMKEFKRGTLYSGSGEKVTDKRQAIAIALSEAGMSKVQWRDELKGGKADNKKPSDFDPVQLVKGIKVEREHTGDKHIATEVAMDHLTESKNYYIELEKMEKHLSKSDKLFVR